MYTISVFFSGSVASVVILDQLTAKSEAQTISISGENPASFRFEIYQPYAVISLRTATRSIFCLKSLHFNSTFYKRF